MGLISRVSSRTYRKMSRNAKHITLKPSDSCICETLQTIVEAGVEDLSLETEFRITLNEVIKIDIPLNVECKCVGIKVNPGQQQQQQQQEEPPHPKQRWTGN